MSVIYSNLSSAIKQSRKDLYDFGDSISTNNWQGIEKPPEFLELLNVGFIARMPATVDEMNDQCKPMQPWADEHFEERVSGLPLNPPPSHVRWLKGNEESLKEGKFSHSYPERMHQVLFQAVELLKNDPSTRQCFVPIWNPLDNELSLKNERVPCTLGWHFILRDGLLHCFYPMRSCDALRHFMNDIYFAARLTLWMIIHSGIDALPGLLTFQAVSFHCFKNDTYALGKTIKC